MQPAVLKAPRTIVCYICGRQYGLSSYDIHLVGPRLQNYPFQAVTDVLS